MIIGITLSWHPAPALKKKYYHWPRITGFGEFEVIRTDQGQIQGGPGGPVGERGGVKLLKHPLHYHY
jgi:hypothetical protein